MQVEKPDYVVTVAVNDESMGIAYIGEEGTTTATSPHEGTGTLVLTAVASEGYQFDGWYRGEELVSDEAVYTTTAITEDRDYVAAFSRIIMNYTVTVNNTTPDGGSITLSYTEGGAAVQSGDQVEEGTSLTVTVTPNAQMELSSLVINGEECAGDYTAEGYVFTVEDDTEITVAFAAQVFTLEFSSTGGGHIEIWTAMDDTGWYPGGTQYESGDEVIGSMIYIFSYPEGREELESLTINGEPQDISELEFWGSIGYKVEEDVNIVAVFSGETPSGVEEAAADAVKVYSAAGAIVIESGEAVSADIYTAGGVLVKSVTAIAGTDRIEVPDGIYMVKVGAKVLKVAVR